MGINAHQHRLRQHRLQSAGCHYLLTVCTHSRERRFDHSDSAMVVSRLLNESHLWRGGNCLGWVLMPYHFHAVVRLDIEGGLSSILRRVKCVTAAALNEHDEAKGTVWQRAFFETCIRRPEELDAKIRYVLLNPVRAGLATTLGDYPFWNCRWAIDEAALGWR